MSKQDAYAKAMAEGVIAPRRAKPDNDPVNPAHYRNDPSGLECIELLEHFASPMLAQAFGYVWRCGQKDHPAQEMDKALWFIGRELRFRQEFYRATEVRGEEAERLFTVWRDKTESNLRSAALTLLWRLDSEGELDHQRDFFPVMEVVAALGQQ